MLVANALGSTTWSFNLAVGSALGGLLAVAFGQDAVFVINALSFVLSAWLLSRVRVHEPHADAKALRASDFVDFRPVMEGFRYIASQPRLFATLMAKFGLGFMGASYVILPLFGQQVFPIVGAGRSTQDGAMLGMSLLMGARGAGALIGPICGAWWAGGRPEKGRIGILLGFLIFAAGYIFLSAVPNIWLAVAAVIFAHGGGANIWVFSTTMLQTQAEDRFRGRVFSADFAFLVIAMSASSYVAGVASDLGVGVRMIALATGLLALIPAAGWVYFALPQWKNESGADDANT
jgi:MFS family permease